MPIYEYRCTSCGATREVLQKLSDKPLKKCPECSGALEKLISRSSFQLKGTGWYASDYGSKSNGTDSKSEAKKEPPTSTDNSSKADASSSGGPASKKKAGGSSE